MVIIMNEEIKKIKNEHFDQVFQLMKSSFPVDEYRTYEEQKELLNNSAYSIYARYDAVDSITSFIALWEFDEFIFIEHFAVDEGSRNTGIGTKMLNEIIERFDKRICLEVEPPEGELSRRRIDFYKRNKFFLSEYPYTQPAMSEGKKAIPLFIMTTNGEVDEETFEQIRSTLYTEVYKCDTSFEKALNKAGINSKKVKEML